MTIDPEAYGLASAIGLGVGYVLKSLAVTSRAIPAVVWIATTVVYTLYTGDLSARGIVVGLCAGLTASGLHSGVKNSLERREPSVPRDEPLL